MRKHVVVLLFLIISACSPFEYAPAPPTPEVITAAYPPTLSWMETFLNNCAEQTPGMILLVEERVSPDLQAADVFLSLGAPSKEIPNHHATLLGYESLIPIANNSIDPDSITVSAIRKSYTSLEPAYQAWTYPAGYRLYQIFETNLLEGDYTPSVLIAPDPEAMLQAIEKHDRAIGFVPEASLNKNVQVISLPEQYQEKLELPVLALTTNEPEGILKVFLGCLTDTVHASIDS